MSYLTNMVEDMLDNQRRIMVIESTPFVEQTPADDNAPKKLTLNQRLNAHKNNDGYDWSDYEREM